MRETGGRSSGFDDLRLALAVSVVVLHVAAVSHGMRAETAVFLSPLRPLVRFILPAFFALSGFLVAGSLARCHTVGLFLGLRALRVMPALTFKVLLAAFVLGPLATRDTLGQYFHNPGLYTYLLNIVGSVHFGLPGVFIDNPLPAVVNGQLWTIPFEVASYVVVAGLAVLGLGHRRSLAPVAAVGITLAYLVTTLARHGGVLVPVPGMPNGALLIACSLWGASLYQYRDTVPHSLSLCLAAAVVAAACLGFVPYGDFLAPLPAAYVTVYLGLRNPQRRWLGGADYSYGIYLSSFMIQQACWQFLPAARSWEGNLLIALPLSVGAAAISWHFIEKPALDLRHALRKIETAWLERQARRGGASLPAEAD
ncbi:MAG TPA: acyltransferase [Acidiphilium sp.]|nr:acyltransferase [Acidiphilium sp.]